MTRGPIDIGTKVRCVNSRWEGEVVEHLHEAMRIRIAIVPAEHGRVFLRTAGERGPFAIRSSHPDVDNGLTVIKEYSTTAEGDAA